jgi:hypothetical protein
MKRKKKWRTIFFNFRICSSFAPYLGESLKVNEPIKCGGRIPMTSCGVYTRAFSADLECAISMTSCGVYTGAFFG